MPTVRATVFGGEKGHYWERELFYRLKSSFGHRANLWHNLPVLSVLSVEEHELRSDWEWHVTLSSSIDFTACDPLTDRPMASMEFDGIGEGYSSLGRYVPGGASSDRIDKMSLKLRLASEAGLPFTVVGPDERRPVRAMNFLTLAHCVMGAMLAWQEEQRTWKARFDELRDYMPNDTLWDNAMKELYARDLARIDAEEKWNPLIPVVRTALKHALATGRAKNIEVTDAWVGEFAYAKAQVIGYDGRLREFPYECRAVGDHAQDICELVALLIASQALLAEA